MMLTIHGLPPKYKFQDVKSLIRQECNISEFILDNLVADDDGCKKVRVGLADGDEGYVLTKCLDRFRLPGNFVLSVVPIAKPDAQRDDYQGNQSRGDFLGNKSKPEYHGGSRDYQTNRGDYGTDKRMDTQSSQRNPFQRSDFQPNKPRSDIGGNFHNMKAREGINQTATQTRDYSGNKTRGEFHNQARPDYQGSQLRDFQTQRNDYQGNLREDFPANKLRGEFQRDFQGVPTREFQGNSYGNQGQTMNQPSPWSSNPSSGPSQWEAAVNPQGQQNMFGYQQSGQAIPPFAKQPLLPSRPEVRPPQSRLPQQEPTQSSFGFQAKSSEALRGRNDGRGHLLRNVDTPDGALNPPAFQSRYPPNPAYQQPDKPVTIMKDNFQGPTHYNIGANQVGQYSGQGQTGQAWGQPGQPVKPFAKSSPVQYEKPYLDDRKYPGDRAMMKGPNEPMRISDNYPDKVRFSPQREPHGRRQSPNRHFSPRRMSPTHRNMPAGRRMSPSGRDIPPGRRLSPSGRDIPPGRRMSPSGRDIPPGRRLSPSGRDIPPGRRMSPSGRDIPLARRISPSGRDAQMGRRISPSGRDVQMGRRLSPSGRNAPMGRRMSPTGRFVPIGQVPSATGRDIGAGRQMSPPGRGLPPGRRISPTNREQTERHAAPTGRRISPPGRNNPAVRQMSSGGRRISPSGRRLSPGGRRLSPSRRLVSPVGVRASPGTLKTGRDMPPAGRRMSPGDRGRDLSRIAGRQLESPPRQLHRYSSGRHSETQADKYGEGAKVKQVRPAYEPPQQAAQSMYSGGYRGGHESGPYPREPDTWHRDREDREQPRRSHPSPHKSRSPMRYKKHSPSPLSPRRSWALEKRTSPDAPPPPLWPTVARTPEWTRANHEDTTMGTHCLPSRDPSYQNFDRKDERRDLRDYRDNRQRDSPRDEMKMPTRKEIDRDFDNVYKKAVEFKKRAEQLRSKSGERRHDDGHDRKREQGIREDRPVWRHEEPEPKRPAVNITRTAREKAVEELATKILMKYADYDVFSTEQKLRVKEELKVTISRRVGEMFGNQEVPFIEIVIKYQGRYNERDEQRLLQDVLASLPSQWRASKRPAPESSAVPAKTSRWSADTETKPEAPKPQRFKTRLLRENRVTLRKPLGVNPRGVLKQTVRPRYEVKRLAYVRPKDGTKAPGYVRAKGDVKMPTIAKPRVIALKKPVKSDKPKAASKPASIHTVAEPEKESTIEAAIEAEMSGSDKPTGHHELTPLMTRAVEAELQDIMIKIWQELPDEPPDEAERKIVDKLRNAAGDDLRNVLGLNITKRLLNVYNPLFVKVQFSGKPERSHLSCFLRKYNFTAFKRIGKANIFAAKMRSINDFDRICTDKDIRCGAIEVTVNPFYRFTKCPPNLKTVFDDSNVSDDEDTGHKVENDPKEKVKLVDTPKPLANKTQPNTTKVSIAKIDHDETTKETVIKTTNSDLIPAKITVTKAVTNKEGIQVKNASNPTDAAKSKLIVGPDTNIVVASKENVIKTEPAITKVEAKSQVKTNKIESKTEPKSTEVKTNTKTQESTNNERTLTRIKTEDNSATVAAKINKPNLASQRAISNKERRGNTQSEQMDAPEDEELNDNDILAFISQGIVLDECSGSDED